MRESSQELAERFANLSQGCTTRVWAFRDKQRATSRRLLRENRPTGVSTLSSCKGHSRRFSTTECRRVLKRDETHVSRVIRANTSHTRGNQLRVGDCPSSEGKFAEELGVSRAMVREVFVTLSATELPDVVCKLCVSALSLCLAARRRARLSPATLDAYRCRFRACERPLISWLERTLGQ